MNNIINDEEIVTRIESKYGMVFTKLERALLESAVIMGAIAMSERNSKSMEEYEERLESFQIELNNYTSKHSIWNLFKRKK